MQLLSEKSHLATKMLIRPAFALMVLLCVGSSAQPAAEQPEVELFRSALQHRFGIDSTASDALTVAPLTEAQVSALILRRLPPRVRAGLRSATGVQFQVTTNGPALPLRFGLLSMTYSDATSAAASGRLLGEHRYFRQTKIATVYGVDQAGERVFLGFTENAGDAKAVSVVGDIPKILRH